MAKNEHTSPKAGTAASKVTLPDELFAKLQAHAVPLVDTPASIIERAIAVLEAGDETAAKATPWGPRSFNRKAAPSLSHTTPRKAVLAGKVLPASATYRHAIMYAVIEYASKRGIGPEDLLELISVNCTKAPREGGLRMPSARASWQTPNAPA